MWTVSPQFVGDTTVCLHSYKVGMLFLELENLAQDICRDEISIRPIQSMLKLKIGRECRITSTHLQAVRERSSGCVRRVDERRISNCVRGLICWVALIEILDLGAPSVNPQRHVIITAFGDCCFEEVWNVLVLSFKESEKERRQESQVYNKIILSKEPCHELNS